jgi:hypothetical protein
MEKINVAKTLTPGGYLSNATKAVRTNKKNEVVKLKRKFHVKYSSQE